jgi:hypothetical protein
VARSGSGGGAHTHIAMSARPAAHPSSLSDVASHVKQNPGRCVALSWFLTVLLCIAMIVVSIVTAAKNSNSETIGGGECARDRVLLLAPLVCSHVQGLRRPLGAARAA